MFEIGDIVRIKQNAREINRVSLGFAGEMDKYCGGIYEICGFDSSRRAYKLTDVVCADRNMNGDGYWLWAEEWLEHADEINIDDVKADEIMNLFV